MQPELVGVLGIALLIVLLAVGIHVAVALMLVGFFGFALLGGLNATLALFGSAPYATTAVFSFSVLPLFILMGHLASLGGIGRDLYSTAYKWLGRLPGGLAIATTGAAAAFGAASGSSLACAATFTRISLPEMLKYGYNKRLAAGCIAAAGTLDIMIPPSGTMVIYGIITGTSIGRLLIAGFIPGFISALVFVTVVLLRVRQHPDWAPVAPERFTWGERLASLRGVWGMLALLVVAMGGIYAGVFTPTEAGAVGAFGAFLIALARGGLKGGTLTRALQETGQTTAMIFVIVIGAMIFGRFLAISRLGPQFVDFVTGLPVHPIAIIIGFMVMYIFLGALMDGAAMMAITLPLVLPVVTALGYNDIWFGILVVKVVQIGLLTPPVGMICFVVASTAADKLTLQDVFRGILPFAIADTGTLIVLIAVPSLSLWLPAQMFG